MKAEIDLRTMKAALDGTPQEIAAAVMQMGGGKTAPSAKAVSQSFTSEEDTTILGMRKDGLGWRAIGTKLNRTSDSIRGRYERLKAKSKPSDKTPAPEPEEKPAVKKLARKPKPESRINLSSHRHSYTDADDDQIAKLYDSGHNDKQIASALGVSVSAVAQRIFKMRKSGKLQERPPVKDSKRGRKPGPRKSKPSGKPSEVNLSDAQIKTIKAGLKDKKSIQVIASELGISSIELMAGMKNLGMVG